MGDTAMARGRLSLVMVVMVTEATAMVAMVMVVMAMVVTAMVVTATATARGLLSLATAMAATVMVVMAMVVTAMVVTATATTVEHHTCYKTPHICDQLRVLNYVRSKKM